MLVTSSSLKPLVFFHLVHVHDVCNALVFTKSVESTTRLVKLFEFFEEERCDGGAGGGNGNGDGNGNGGEEQARLTSRSRTKLVVKAYSSDLPPVERRAILEAFKIQKIHM